MAAMAQLPLYCRLHRTHVRTFRPVEKNCFAGVCAGDSFYMQNLRLTHSLMVKIFSSIQKTAPLKFNIEARIYKPPLGRSSVEHFLYKMEDSIIVVSRGNINQKRSKYANKMCLQTTRNLFLDQIQQETHHKTGLSLRKTTESRARSLLLRVIVQRA